jgi:hypothetical protein
MIRLLQPWGRSPVGPLRGRSALSRDHLEIALEIATSAPDSAGRQTLGVKNRQSPLDIESPSALVKFPYQGPALQRFDVRVSVSGNYRKVRAGGSVTGKADA